MADNETIETKISDKKEKIDEKIDQGKNKYDEKKDEQKEKFEARKEKGKNIADNVVNDFSNTVDEIKEGIKNLQKAADQKYTEYKNSTVKTLDVDLIETEKNYFIKVAVPGVNKDEISIEAGDNDITIEVTFKAFIDEFSEEDEAELISSSLKSGRCVKTIRFENSLDLENINAKFDNGIVIITVPKLIIPKHKINVE
ncbi:Hsp20/alpha crystallin family protein [uncultured Methanobrevibacter sp.]|uniref:Hsp20/alpha crystallin family protein n=1 Tax=uncultured Methanobrevibacter sp. TaxID=253161 RepID=UPI0026009361|nr:Hsp20/alpha crystallin family protein [uncultured Methanobrevibacter sp.]